MKSLGHFRLSLGLALSICLVGTLARAQVNPSPVNLRAAVMRAHSWPMKAGVQRPAVKSKAGLTSKNLALPSIPLNSTPCWSSVALNPQVVSVWGTHFVDLNNDGYPEVVMVGEAMPCYVFANHAGILDTVSSWQSNDVNHSIWASFGDYDHSGYLSMAVANLSFFSTHMEVYHNDSGALNPNPVWTGAGGGVCCDWGSVKNNGYLDLAAVDMFGNPSVYMNHGGTLETVASWQAMDYNIDFGCAWVDVDNDGWLDLVVTGSNGSEPTLRVYHNNHGTLETTASWKSTLSGNDYPGGIPSVGDLDKDGWRDVVVPTNPLSTGSGYNVVFKNNQGVLDSMPAWYSTDSVSSDAGVLGDLNGDGYLDWAVNNDASAAVVYENSGGILNPTPAWQSSGNTGGLGVDLGDVDRIGVRDREDTILADGTKRLFYLSVLPLHSFGGVRVNGQPLPIDAYSYSLKSGWVSLRDSVSAGSQVIVHYQYSINLDLLLSDYYNARANLYRNTTVGVEREEKVVSRGGQGIRVIPNPFVAFASVPGHEAKRFALYDVSGRKMGTYKGDRIGEGVAPGVYFLKGEDKAGKPIRLVKLR